MAYGAPAVGQELRLRSRRIRSARAAAPGPKLAMLGVIGAGMVALVGFVLLAFPMGPIGPLGPMGATDDQPPSWLDALLARPNPAAAAPPLAASSSSAALARPSRASRPRPPSAVASGQEQVYLDDLWSLHARLEQTMVRLGLDAAQYETGEIDRAELRLRLIEALASLHQMDAQVQGLVPPDGLRGRHAEYLSTLGLFEQTAAEMLKVADDGDDAHLSAAVPLSLDGVTRLRALGRALWPEAE